MELHSIAVYCSPYQETNYCGGTHNIYTNMQFGDEIKVLDKSAFILQQNQGVIEHEHNSATSYITLSGRADSRENLVYITLFFLGNHSLMKCDLLPPHGHNCCMTFHTFTTNMWMSIKFNKSCVAIWIALFTLHTCTYSATCLAIMYKKSSEGKLSCQITTNLSYQTLRHSV